MKTKSLIIVFILGISIIYAQNNDCNNVIKFDEAISSSNVVDFFSIQQFIDQSNYEVVKKSANAQYSNLFSGSYEDYKEKLSTYKSEFKSFGFSSVNENYYNNTVNGESVKAYIECIKTNSYKPFIVWVKDRTDSEITIGIKSGFTGNTNLEFKVSGGECLDSTSGNLNSGSMKFLRFKYNPKQDLNIIFNGTEKNTSATYSDNITIPKIRKIKPVRITKELYGTLECRAGGFGDVRGNRYVRNFTFVADNGFSILPNTLKLIEEIKGGIGVNSYTFVSPKKTIIENNKVINLSLEFLDVVGNHEHEQGGATLKYKVIEEKTEFVEF